MVANQAEFRIRAAGWSWPPARNPPKDRFSVYVLWTQGTALCLKSSQRPTSVKTDAHSARIVSFCSFTIAGGPHCHLWAFSTWKQGSCWRYGPCQSFSSVHQRALNDKLAASDFHGNREISEPTPCRLRHRLADAYQILLILPLSGAPTMSAEGLQKAILDWSPYPVHGGTLHTEILSEA
jgi:hypothetical protein